MQIQLMHQQQASADRAAQLVNDAFELSQTVSFLRTQFAEHAVLCTAIAFRETHRAHQVGLSVAALPDIQSKQNLADSLNALETLKNGTSTSPQQVEEARYLLAAIDMEAAHWRNAGPTPDETLQQLTAARDRHQDALIVALDAKPKRTHLLATVSVTTLAFLIATLLIFAFAIEDSWMFSTMIATLIPSLVLVSLVVYMQMVSTSGKESALRDANAELARYGEIHRQFMEFMSSPVGRPLFTRLTDAAPALLVEMLVKEREGPVASVTKTAGFHIGQPVSAVWRFGGWFPGTLQQTNEDGTQWLVVWSDGDRPKWVSTNQIRPR